MRWFFLLLVVTACRPRPCEEETTLCGCAQRSDCSLEVDGCYCPSQCGAEVQCVCGGGTFKACHTR